MKFLKYRARIGNGSTRPEICTLIKEVLDKAEADTGIEVTNEERVFIDNLPPKSWVHRFVTRHKDISLRTPEHLGHMRKKVTEKTLRDWFSELDKFLLEEHHIVAKDFFVPENSARVFNLDETGFPLSGTNKLKVVSEKGTKNVYSVSSESKEQITVMGCVSADGNCEKPFVILPGVRPIFQFKTVDPGKYDVGVTPNGWISSDSFFGWFSNLFYNAIKNRVTFPVIVFMDGHSSHINVAVAEFCRDHQIILYCFPAHASHVIQPLDICVYGPLKKKWNSAVKQFQIKYNQMMSKANFFPVFDEAWEHCKQSKSNIISGFKKAGLLPFDPDALDYSRLIDEEKSAADYRNNVCEASAEQKLGIMRALKCFDAKISPETMDMFNKRYEEGYDVINEDISEVDQFYNTFKAIKDMLKSNTPHDTQLNVADISSQNLVVPSSENIADDSYKYAQ